MQLLEYVVIKKRGLSESHMVRPRPQGVGSRFRGMEAPHDQVRILVTLLLELNLTQGLLLLRRRLEGGEVEVVVKVAVEPRSSDELYSPPDELSTGRPRRYQRLQQKD